MRVLIASLWEETTNEHCKMTCLHVIDEYIGDPALMKHYLALADTVDGIYLKECVSTLRRRKR